MITEWEGMSINKKGITLAASQKEFRLPVGRRSRYRLRWWPRGGERRREVGRRKRGG